jgi:hypothetical protein
VFGLNALKVYALDAAAIKQHLPSDAVGQARMAYQGAEDPAFLTYGPR